MMVRKKSFRFLSHKFSVTIICLLSIFFLKLISELYLLLSFEESFSKPNIEDGPIILWWTPFKSHDNLVSKTCGNTTCFFTQDRQYLQHNQTKIIIFYGSGLNFTDLPVEKIATPDGPYWALIHEESARNMPALLHNVTLNLFNFSSTFSRFSSFPVTTQHLSSLQDLVGNEFIVPLSKKNELLSKLAPVLYIQSDCNTPVNRDSYVLELMKYIAVDSYGKCLNNKRLPQDIANRLETLNSEESAKKFLHFVAQYKFVISFENSVCHDYITEKLWRPLIVGSVPIYYGSPSILDWLPNNKSTILVSNFESPAMLAEFIRHLNENDSEYLSYLSHKDGDVSFVKNFRHEKVHHLISNNRLVKTMTERSWVTDLDSGTQFPDAFECFLCQQLFNPKRSSNQIVDESHYSCPEPVSMLFGHPNESNWWRGQWRIGKCEGVLLRDAIHARKSMSINDFNEKLMEYINSDRC